MKCANETVTIELKNGESCRFAPSRSGDRLQSRDSPGVSDPE